MKKNKLVRERMKEKEKKGTRTGPFTLSRPREREREREIKENESKRNRRGEYVAQHKSSCAANELPLALAQTVQRKCDC